MAEPVGDVVPNAVDSQEGAAITPAAVDPPEKPVDSEAMTVDAGNSKPEPTEKEAKPDEATEEAPAVEPSEDVDAELEAMKKRLQEMEQETMALQPKDEDAAAGGSAKKADGAKAENGDGAAAAAGKVDAEGGAPGIAVDEATADSDGRSIYVGNVDYKATGGELGEYFQDCGTINRVTIMCHKATGQPKGFAYIEFKEQDSVQNALILNESVFRGRTLKVVEKRTNIPSLHRGGFSRGRPRFTRGWRGGGFGRRPRGRGRVKGRWAPY